VEVKTVFGEKHILEQERFMSDLAQYCSDRRLPVESLDLEGYPEDYDYSEKKNNIFADVETLIIKQMPLDHNKTIKYVNIDGFSIEIDLSPGASRVVSRGYVSCSRIVEVLKSRKPQISKDNIPSILIINDFNFNIDRTVVEDALFGTLVHDETCREKISYFRKNDGIWSLEIPSNLNAVIVLRFEGITMRVKTLDAYICPNPHKLFKVSMFSIPRLVWRQLNADGVNVEDMPS
jgi:hypothetical protein